MNTEPEYTERATIDGTDVVFDLFVHEEDVQPEGQFSDPRDVAAIREKMEAGDPWAWFTAECRASLASEPDSEIVGPYGSDMLGGCSYASAADFTTPGGYWDDMKAVALEELRAEIKARAAYAAHPFA